MLKLKKIALASLIALPLAITGVSAVADDYIEHQILTDKNYPTVVANAKAMLEKDGYQVVDIEADDHKMQPALSVEAYKGGVEYDIKLSYPDLKILKQKIDD